MIPFDEACYDLLQNLEPASRRAAVIRRGERLPIPDWVRLDVLRRDGFACAWCKGTQRLVLDHIVPWSAGGTDDPTNLRTLCWWENEWRSNHRWADITPRLPIAMTCELCDEGTADGDDLAAAFCSTCRRRSKTDADALRYYRQRMQQEQRSAPWVAAQRKAMEKRRKERETS